MISGQAKVIPNKGKGLFLSPVHLLNTRIYLTKQEVCRLTPLRFVSLCLYFTWWVFQSANQQALNQSHGTLLHGGSNVILYALTPRFEALLAWIFADHSTRFKASIQIITSLLWSSLSDKSWYVRRLAALQWQIVSNYLQKSDAHVCVLYLWNCSDLIVFFF